MKKSIKKKISSASGARVRSDHALVGTWKDPEKNMWIPVRYNHPLSGTWQEVENSVSENSVIYKIAVVNGHFVVSGIEEDTGTELEISDVKWNGEALEFTSLFPPTGHRVKHVLRVYRPGLVDHEVTYTGASCGGNGQKSPVSKPEFQNSYVADREPRAGCSGARVMALFEDPMACAFA